MRALKLTIGWVLACIIMATTACSPDFNATPVVSVSPYFSNPLSTFSSPLKIPRPEAGKGHVHGFLSLTHLPIPLETTELYLGNILTSSDSRFYIYYFNRNENPRGRWINAETGEFLFENVPPGEYVLILWWDIQSYTPIYPVGSTSAITITVTADSLVELGVIVSNQ